MLSREQELISQYEISEPGLNALLIGVCAQPQNETEVISFNNGQSYSELIDENKMAIIKNALRGDYSDYGSKLPMPQTTLIRHLEIAGYDELVKKAINGDFEHDYGAKPSKTHSNYLNTYVDRTKQEYSMHVLFKVLKENPDITMENLENRIREEEENSVLNKIRK